MRLCKDTDHTVNRDRGGPAAGAGAGARAGIPAGAGAGPGAGGLGPEAMEAMMNNPQMAALRQVSHPILDPRGPHVTHRTWLAAFLPDASR